LRNSVPIDTLPFGVTIPATVPQWSEIPEGLTNYSVFQWPCFLLSFNVFYFFKVAFLLPSFKRNPLPEICQPVDASLIQKEIK
jgi:hypothetical protein